MKSTDNTTSFLLGKLGNPFDSKDKFCCFFSGMELALGGGSEDNCFFDAFEDPSWVDCISPILFEVQGEFNVTAIW